MAETKILWDLSTAYDFLLSLRLLHEPKEWQIRGAWAAGVRSRLSPENRAFMKEAYALIFLPASWIYTLDPPKDGATLLTALDEIPIPDRLGVLMGHSKPGESEDSPLTAIYQRVASTGEWTEEDQRKVYRQLKMYDFSRKKVQTLLHWWANLEEFGQRIQPALKEYYEVFFAEEETRIGSALQEALEKAQRLSETLAPQPLVEELAIGIRYESFPDYPELVLAPSFWATPLILFGSITPRRALFLFGARPDDASLVPGEVVPDALYRALKALADPTRLRIMRYLSKEPHTPAQLSRKLRLRPPTVVHHLHVLRLAQLVEITFTAEDKRRYTSRPAAVQQTIEILLKFLADKQA